jgi:hypothetical protein
MTPVVLLLSMVLNALLFLSYIDLQFSLDSHSMQMEQNYILPVIPFKGSWIEFSTDINSVMYAYIDRKKITCYYFIPCNWIRKR